MGEAGSWQEFFDTYASRYMDEVFTKGTEGEVEFLVAELDLPLGARILDVGCGTGRHAIGLARRGYLVTGIDLSAGMLAEASRAARAAGVGIELVQADATDFTVDELCDAAVCLCEGAFCLLGDGDDPLEHDRAILRCVAAALKPGAKLVLTALSAFYHVRVHGQEDVERGLFDPVAMVENERIEWRAGEEPWGFTGRQRVYVPTELTAMLTGTGFTVEHVWGGTAGSWGRRPIDLDEMEIMVVARR